mgnify:CR=1 FL=1
MRINPKDNIYGQYRVSPDPSVTHRALILGSVAKGKTYVINPCLNDDSYTAVSCIKKLGAKVRIKNGVVEIKPPKSFSGGARIECERSDTIMRFLCGIAAGSGLRLELTGDKWLCQRSMRNVKEPLEAMGATVALKNYSVPPILVEGETVRPIDYFLPIGSSQVKSSILLCALTGRVKARIKEGIQSRNHMEILLKEMGADITVNEAERTVNINESEIKGTKLYVCGDFTEALYFLAQGLISGRTECKNVGVNPTRTRVLNLLKRMGARIKIVNRRTLCGEPIADLIAEKSNLKAILVTDEEAYSVIDELPALAVVMGMAKGESIIAEHKALHDLDSSYFDEISETINAVGGKCRRFYEKGVGGLAVTGVERYFGGEVKTLNSAKIGMAAAIALSVSENGGEILDETLLSAEYPEFLTTLAANHYAYVCKAKDYAGYSAMNSFVLEKLGVKGYVCEVKEARGAKKMFSEIKDSEGYSACFELASDAAKKALKYKGSARNTKAPDVILGAEGVSTDSTAVEFALSRRKIDVENKKILLLGSGVAAKNVANILAEKRAVIDVFDPLKKNASDSLKKRFADEVYALGELSENVRYDLIVNATKIGGGGYTGESPVGEKLLKSAGAVVDFVCNAEDTELITLAKKNGIDFIDGKELAFFKAYAGSCFFAGMDPSESEAIAFYEEYTKSENKF